MSIESIIRWRVAWHILQCTRAAAVIKLRAVSALELRFRHNHEITSICMLTWRHADRDIHDKHVCYWSPRSAFLNSSAHDHSTPHLICAELEQQGKRGSNRSKETYLNNTMSCEFILLLLSSFAKCNFQCRKLRLQSISKRNNSLQNQNTISVRVPTLTSLSKT
jgi:hypothetical protein